MCTAKFGRRAYGWRWSRRPEVGHQWKAGAEETRRRRSRQDLATVETWTSYRSGEPRDDPFSQLSPVPTCSPHASERAGHETHEENDSSYQSRNRVAPSKQQHGQHPDQAQLGGQAKLPGRMNHRPGAVPEASLITSGKWIFFAPHRTILQGNRDTRSPQQVGGLLGRVLSLPERAGLRDSRRSRLDMIGHAPNRRITRRFSC